MVSQTCGRMSPCLKTGESKNSVHTQHYLRSHSTHLRRRKFQHGGIEAVASSLVRVLMSLGRRESEGDLASSPTESQRGWSSRLSSRGQSRLGSSQTPQAFTTWSELTLGSQAWVGPLSVFCRSLPQSIEREKAFYQGLKFQRGPWKPSYIFSFRAQN